MEIIKEFILPDDTISGTLVTREACRAVIFDEKNMMPLLFVAKEKYHKLPGWWIEIGEDKKTALTRELQEETWCEAEITKEIGITIESNSTRKQTSYCYIGRVTKKSEPNYTDKEKEKGFELKRVTIDEAITLIQWEKRESETAKRVQQRDLAILEKAKLSSKLI